MGKERDSPESHSAIKCQARQKHVMSAHGLCPVTGLRQPQEPRGREWKGSVIIGEIALMMTATIGFSVCVAKMKIARHIFLPSNRTPRQGQQEGLGWRVAGK